MPLFEKEGLGGNVVVSWSKTALAVLQAIAEAIALPFFKQLALNLMAVA